jgi:hypothetical protein
MGSIDLDPATCIEANRTICADISYTKEQDGLAQQWHGNVWLNPPYGRTDGKSNQAVWSQKLIDEVLALRVNEGVLLVNSCTAERWFQQLWDYPICFTDHRIQFIGAGGEAGKQPTHGSVFVYFGPVKKRQYFAERFSEFGRVVMPCGGGLSEVAA